MYSESDLQDAVAAGAIPAQAAQALRDHVAARRASPMVDEEHFRLLTGFNDIFVAIASVLLLLAVGWLGNGLRFGAPDHHPAFMAGLLVAAVSWGLAEYFTRRRHMALPSILLLGGFVGGIVFAIGALGAQMFPDAGDSLASMILCVAAGAGVLAAWAHWRRFMVPITVAVGAAAAAGVGVSLVMAAMPGSMTLPFTLLLVAGLAIFALAMWWDMSDRARTTRRSDVAFWLHLAAAPMIAHSLFYLLGVLKGDEISAGRAALVIALYVAFGLVALAIDRRALLVSSLAYVLFALYGLFRQAGAVEMSWALTALVIGSALLLLSALWHHARALIVGGLPPRLSERLPYLDRAVA
ncbi:hypothetical protein [Sphingobium cupriresistens]|uniref:DUF2157 domain-containing protein n=1 Tax=Sphingobium cupriresistens LL01 TaxID=1420583 RepID=A0A0J7Y213_9SPHN|nr:hypothetical protein [Sphingobium cupriresistens]KMS57468.1 hypothetical protein V473_04400 [Sphingobium cupriresistens LL01]